MPSFIPRLPLSRSHNLDIVTDTPSLKHSPSTISSTSQSSISVSLRRRVSSFASKFHFRRGRSTTSKASKSAAIQHISNVRWSRSPSRSPSPPSPDIRPPSGLGRRASSISDLDTLAALDEFPIPCSSRGSESLSYESPPSLSADVSALPPSPLPVVRPDPAPSSIPVPPSSHQHYQARPVRTRTLSSPALLGSPTETSPTPLQQQQQQQQQQQEQHLVVPTTSTTDAQTYEPHSPRHIRLKARLNPPIPLSFLFPHVPRAQLPVLALVSRRFRAAVQLALYRTLTLTTAEEADACIARLAVLPHLATLVTTLVLPAYPPAHAHAHAHGGSGAATCSFQLALGLALRTMRAVSALTLPAFDAELLAEVPPTLARLTLLADTLPFAFFDQFLPARPHIVQLALPNFVGVPPGAGEVPSTAVPALASLDASPGLAVALAPGRPLRRVTLRVASTLYDGLRPAALFAALSGSEQLKELVLVLAPDVDARTRGRLLGALAKTGAELEVLELHLEGTSNEVTLQTLYKQVGMLLPNVRALRTLRLHALGSVGTAAAETEEGPSRLAVWTRPALGSTLRRIVFPSGSHWELEHGEWVRVN